MAIISNVVWINPFMDDDENIRFVKELENTGYLRVRCFKKIDEAINYIKSIRFEETKIIVNGKLYIQFIEKFIDNLKDIYIIPKIIIYSKNKNKFIENCKEYKNIINHSFYNFDGIKTTLDEVKKFIINYKEKKILNRNEDDQLTFEYIDCKEKLTLPIFYKTFIDITSIDKIEKYIESIYTKYAKNNKDIEELLSPIKYMSNIPIELLSKYYIRLYTLNSNFYSDINKDLRENKKEKFLPYIKTLYEGIKLKSLPIASDKVLYRGTKILNIEIQKIKNYLNNKIEGLPGAIVFSRAFLSFSKEKNIAEGFLNDKINNDKLSKVLFILEKDDNIDYSLSTHADIQKMSIFPDESEVLFFPFSSFELKEIKEINIKGEKRYEIKLLYLGKYIKEIEKENTNIEKENNIPNSEFKKQIIELGLINPKKIENKNQIIRQYKQYKEEIRNKITIREIKEMKKENNLNNNKDDNSIRENPENNINLESLNKNEEKNKDIINNELDEKIKNNLIISEINIAQNEINKKFRIINSFEEFKRNNLWYNEKNEDEYKNEKEIKENIEIKINDKLIPFNYFWRFNKEGKHIIKYIFKNNFTKIINLFSECNSLISLNLSNFNTENVTDMSYMFFDCKSLKNIDLSNFNTENVIDMERMFYNCNSLTNINLSNFNTQNVIDMREMFNGCKSLTNINLSNFNTQNVKYMSGMFNGCKSLKNINLSNFNTQNVTDMSEMFFGCNTLEKNNIITNDNKILNLFK